jgi:hypothetical protein
MTEFCNEFFLMPMNALIKKSVCVCERFFVADIELILDCAFIGVAFE